MAAFLDARLDEDEAIARTAAMSAKVHMDGYADGDWSWLDSYGQPQLADIPLIDHQMRFDPNHVLREVDAKRKRLALYLDAKETFAAALKKAPPEGDPATTHSYVRERINVNQASGRFTALEMSVRLDVMAYNDHPDYRQEWAPS